MGTCGTRPEQQESPSHWRALACGQRRGRRSLFHGIWMGSVLYWNIAFQTKYRIDFGIWQQNLYR
jgi:hypothetical protein